MIERTARALYPDASPATLNRQAFTPIAAVLNHAAKRGLCAQRVIERPEQPKGRVRWLTFEEAERLLDACAAHLRPLVMFLLGDRAPACPRRSISTGGSSILRRRMYVLDTKNGEARGVPLHPRLVNELRDAAPQAGAGVPHPCGASPMRKKRAAAGRSRPLSEARAGGPE